LESRLKAMFAVFYMKSVQSFLRFQEINSLLLSHDAGGLFGPFFNSDVFPGSLGIRSGTLYKPHVLLYLQSWTTELPHN